MELFSTRMRKLWNDWEIKVLILFNLVLQVVLIFLGARRKFTPKLWLKIIVWGAYISTDAVAGVALGILSSKLGEIHYRDQQLQLEEEEQCKLMAFWAPSLLLLLGGPDTITAYSLEDNELWLRHLLGLVVQTVVTAYIFIMAWTVSYMSLLELLMFMAAIIKYGERVWVLWLASSENLRDSMLGPPDPSPNYPRFMEDYSLKQMEGYHVYVDEVDEFLQVVPDQNLPETIESALELMNADRLFQIFKRLFIHLILSSDDRDLSLSIFSSSKIDWKSGFEIVAMELGFMYDLLHTKAAVIYSKWGLLRRSITLTVSISVLVSFSVQHAILRPQYPTVDLVVTYLMLGVIVFLEIKSILLLASSDWTTVWLIKNKESRLANTVSLLRLQCFKQPRTSNCFGQLEFLTFCTRQKRPPFWKILSHGLKEKADKYYHTSYQYKLTGRMKKIIFSNLQEMREQENNHHFDHKRFLLQGHTNLAWSTSQLEFDHCLLLWHLATELCYNEDPDQKEYNEEASMTEETYEKYESRFSSILLSRYMFYLLVRYPFMLPSGIGQIRLRDTFHEASQFFQERGLFSNNDEASRYEQACKDLTKVNTEVPPSKVKGGRSKSVLFDGCRLATELNKLETNEKWKLISKFWMQILVCAASGSRGDAHARMLGRGGELLTHIWLIMAHLGLTDHFQMTQSHAIAKLILK